MLSGEATNTNLVESGIKHHKPINPMIRKPNQNSNCHHNKVYEPTEKADLTISQVTGYCDQVNL